MDKDTEFNEQQFKQIKTDLLNFKNNKEQLKNILALYVSDTDYSRASISKAVKEVEQEVDFKLSL